MHKEEFLRSLRTALTGLPQDELEASLAYFSESIDDRIEEGAAEAEAVAAMGAVENAAAQILSSVSLQKIVRERIRPRRKLRAWEILLLVLGAPAWIPLTLAAVILLLSAYLVIWCVVVTLYSIDLSFALVAASGVVGLIYFLTQHYPAQALLGFGTGLIAAGLCIYGLFLCNAVLTGAVRLTKKMGLCVKTLFVGKEHAA